MKLYQITLPYYDNARRTLGHAHEDFQRRMLSIAGGYTACGSVTGTWLDNHGQRFDDVSNVYQLATTPALWPAVLEAAFKLFPDQLAIFWAELGAAKIEDRPVSAQAA